jgi:hypothetical protein
VEKTSSVPGLALARLSEELSPTVGTTIPRDYPLAKLDLPELQTCSIWRGDVMNSKCFDSYES